MDYTDLSPGLTEAGRKSLETVFPDMDFSSFLSRLTGGENPVAPESMAESMKGLVLHEFRAQLGLLSALIAVILLFAVAEHFSSSLSAKGLGKAVGLLLSGAVASLGVGGLVQNLSIARDTVESMIFFTRYAGMCMAYLAAVSGAPVSGPAMAGVLSSVLSVMGDLAYRAVLPLSAVSAGLGVLHYAFFSVSLEGMAKLMGSAAKWTLGVFSTLFLALLGVTGMATGSLDGIGGKTAKFMISSLVPVVGATLSEAMDTVAGAGLVTYRAVGALGVLLLIGITLSPIIHLGVSLFLFRLLAAFSEMIAQKRAAGILSSIAGGVTLIFGMVALLSVLFAVSMGLMITCTGFGVSIR